MAHARKTPAGRWQGIAKAHGERLGTRVFDRKGDALRWAGALEAAYKEGGTDPRAGKVLLSELLPVWLEHRRATVSRGAVGVDENLARLLTPALLGREVGSIRPLDLQNWFVHLREQGQSDSSMKRYRNSLGSFFAWCVDSGRRSSNPVAVAKLPARVDPQAQMKPLSESELVEVVAKIREWSPWSADVVLVLGSTGLRWGECRALLVSDLVLSPFPALRVSKSHSEGGEVKPPKSGKERLIPVSNSVLPVLQGMARGKRSADRLVTGAAGGQLWRSAFLRTSRFSEVSGGSRIHDLRHSFAINALRRSVDVALVSRWLGHSSITVTDRYVKHQGTRADMAGLELLNAEQEGEK